MNISILSRPTHLAHLLISELIRPGDTVVDATCGNGHDTLFLCEKVGPTGKVHAFDIQQEAIDSTREKLSSQLIEEPRFQLHLKSHHLIQEVVQDEPSVIMFNLGYLPGTDKETITAHEQTILAVENAAAALKVGGMLSIICYPGHEGGDVEAEKILYILSQWDGKKWKTAQYRLLNTLKKAPFLIVAYKVK